MYNSTYVAEYVSDTQSVLLRDAVSQVDAHVMEFIAFRRLNRATFGPEVAQKIETALCGYEPVVINWARTRVAIRKPRPDLVGSYLRHALHPETMEDRLFLSQSPNAGDDLREYDRALLGLADDARDNPLRSLL